MLIYIVTFLISLFFTFIAQKMFEIGKKNIGYFASFFAILFPTFIAGIRDKIVGTDTTAYIRYFNLACETNDFIEYSSASRLEIGFDFVTFLISRISDDYHVFLFFIELLIIMPIYIRVYEKRKENSMILTMAVIYLLMFNLSLNISRQCIAIAIIIFGWKYIEKRSLIKYFITILIAMSFHLTAIVALPIYFIFWLLQMKFKIFSKILIFIGVVIAVVSFVGISQLLIDYGILPANYENYLDIDTYSTIDLKQILLRGPFILILVVAYRKLKRENTFIESYSILLVIELIFALSGRRNQLLGRISYFYQLPIYTYILPYLRKAFKNDRLNTMFYNFICIGILFLYWYYTVVHIGYYNTIPYVTDII